jgi:aspartyl-tRNA(Asn)/glutamyl-tRNA(Gln) amidotransferase subunit B
MEEFLRPACLREEEPVSSSRVTPEKLAALSSLMDGGVLGRRAVQEMFPEFFRTGGDPGAIAEARGLVQITDAGALAAMAAEVVAAHPGETAKYRAGQEKIMGFLVGQVMRRSKGTADPKGASRALLDAINASEGK